MSHVAVWAKIPAQPGKRDELAKALQGALETAKGESGTLTYILHEDPKDPDALYFYELYADQAALDAHMGSDAFKALGPALAAFVGGRPEMKVIKPIGGKGI
ncbi:MAG: putative quinol monooxygenase [Ilumatobacteraceae bacterium]